MAFAEFRYLNFLLQHYILFKILFDKCWLETVIYYLLNLFGSLKFFFKYTFLLCLFVHLFFFKIGFYNFQHFYFQRFVRVSNLLLESFRKHFIFLYFQYLGLNLKYCIYFFSNIRILVSFALQLPRVVLISAFLAFLPSQLQNLGVHKFALAQLTFNT